MGRVVSNDGSTGRIVSNTLTAISKGRLFLATITILVMRSDFDSVDYSRILKRFVKTLVSADRFIIVRWVLLLVKKRFSGDNDR